jgi:hypothetical protein
MEALGKQTILFFFKNSLPSALYGGTRQRNYFFSKILCRVPCMEALGKEINFFFQKFFAECLGCCT